MSDVQSEGNRVQLTQEERLARLRLARTAHVGPITYRQLISRYGTAGAALTALPELARRGGMRKRLRACPLSTARAELEALEQRGGAILILGETRYPQHLASILDAPPVLSLLGHEDLLSKEWIAIVGTRNASANGCLLAERLSRACGAAGYGIASGLARGIDTAVNRAALASGTLAVLAGGVDNIYPPENETLYHQIVARGLIVSEMPFAFTPSGRHFPRRNRIISGLSVAVVVVEASLRSGALITARYALDQGREVFAVPGAPYDGRAQGANRLIRDGAYLIETESDIFAVLGKRRAVCERSTFEEVLAPPPEALSYPDLGELRERLYTLIGYDQTSLDDIIRMTESTSQRVNAAILELELAGRVTRQIGNSVVRLQRVE